MADLLITVLAAPGAAVAAVTETQAVANTFDNQFTHDRQGKLLIFVQNGASAKEGRVRSVPCSHGRSADITWTVDANKLYVIGPLPPTLFVNADGRIEVNVNDATNVKMWAIVVPEAG